MERAAQRWCSLDLDWVYGELLRGILRRTHCAQRALDVLHDALIRFALAGHRGPIEQPHAYLRTVVGSVLVDHARDASRFAPLPDVEAAVPGWTAPAADQIADLRQRLEAVQRILDGLPPRCREAFTLFRIDGCTQPEIAARLGISLNMVERHVMRALIDLRAARDLLG